MKKTLLYWLLLLFFIADTGYSFVQYLGQTLDGDMPGNVLPADGYKPVLSDPLALGVLLKHKTYSNPNRFFCHWAEKEYLRSVPLFLQKFAQPIESVYISCAIVKLLIQIALIFLFAVLITNTTNVFKLDFMIAVILVMPLFQTNGYRSYMGIIDPATTYVFFYALPCALLILYLLPFIRQFYHQKTKSSVPMVFKILWIPFAIIVCLSGPLNPGIALVLFALVLLENFKKNYFTLNQNFGIKKVIKAVSLVPQEYWFYLLPVSILSLYSLYIGKYNDITIVNQIPLSELYSRLPAGVYYQFTQKLGFPVLFIILTLNMIMISRYKTDKAKKLLSTFKWIGLFAVVYILLLPLGGYRSYRYYILRYDTIMPITLSLMSIFGISTLFLFKNLNSKQKIWYIPVIILVLFTYTNADEPFFENNRCEKNALKTISESKESIVQLPNDCNVLSWEKISKPEDSELNAQLLRRWGITEEKKLYYQDQKSD